MDLIQFDTFLNSRHRLKNLLYSSDPFILPRLAKFYSYSEAFKFPCSYDRFFLSLAFFLKVFKESSSYVAIWIEIKPYCPSASLCWYWIVPIKRSMLTTFQILWGVSHIYFTPKVWHCFHCFFWGGLFVFLTLSCHWKFFRNV